MTITLGWWAVPLAITVLSFGFSIWRTGSSEPHGDYGMIGQALFLVTAMAASAIVSLLSWLIWALAA